MLVETDGTGVDGNGVERIHQRLRAAILRGDLPPGASMSQVQLAGELGVSRTPLREGLRMLQREGLIEASANRQVRVAGFSTQDLEQLYALRITNEALGVRLTVPQMTAEDDRFLVECAEQLNELARVGDIDTWEVHHRALHDRLVKGAGGRISSLLAELSDHSERYRRLYISSAPRAWTVGAEEHQAIIEACIARDSSEAARRLARHLARTALTVLMTTAPEHEPAMVRSALRAVTAEEEPRSVADDRERNDVKGHRASEGSDHEFDDVVV